MLRLVVVPEAETTQTFLSANKKHCGFINHAMINDAWCKIQTLNVYIRMISQLMKMILRDSLEGNGCPTHIIMHLVDIQVVPTWDEIYTCFIDSTAHSMS